MNDMMVLTVPVTQTHDRKGSMARGTRFDTKQPTKPHRRDYSSPPKARTCRSSSM